MSDFFPHERLDCYQLAKEVAVCVMAARFPARSGDLHDQAARAAISVVTNIAEGSSTVGAVSRNHFRIARGSAGEVCATLDLCGLVGAPDQQARLRRIGAMLRGLGGSARAAPERAAARGR